MRTARIPAARGESASFGDARSACTAMANEIAPRLAQLKLDIHVQTPAVVVEASIDGSPIPTQALAVPRKLNPGKHDVVVRARGNRDARREITLREGESTTLTVKLEPSDGSEPTDKEAPAAPTPPPTAIVSTPTTSPATKGAVPTYAWAGLGVGAAGLVTGAITGLMAMSKTNDVKANCVGDSCLKSSQGDIDSAKTLALVSNIGFACMIVGGGVGLYGILTRGSTESSKSVAGVELDLGVGRAGLRGQF